ncbi:hypothetical protein FRX31_007376 [Thalictrum thalictroides]|uniref:Uncharacterized protein n=1 Tax=Thalictrum thalictroides TaxID=46969 RepID=A0A7J6X2L9_THATH|nr:hypothetical protein FRX31_007376 [Thalictrum thalictroides]
MNGNFLSLKLRSTMCIEEQIVKPEEDETKNTVPVKGLTDPRGNQIEMYLFWPIIYHLLVFNPNSFNGTGVLFV